MPTASTSETGLEFVGSVANELKKLREEVAVLQETSSRLRTDLALEAKLRGGDIAALQHGLSSHIVEVVATLRTEAATRADTFEATTRKWAGALGQEAVAAKHRLDHLETAVAERVAAQVASDGQVAALGEALQVLRNHMTSVDDKYACKAVVLQSQVDANREEAASALRAAAAKAAQDLLRAEEHLETLQHQEEATKKALSAAAAGLGAKIEALEAFAQTRAKASDVQALELRVNETIEKSLKAIHEELSRKEYATTVKALADRLADLGLEVHAHAARAKTEEEVLASRIADLGQGLAKTVRQLDADRERSNGCWVSLEREVSIKAARVDLDVAVGRIAGAEGSLKTMAPVVASKAAAEAVTQLQARTQALEHGFPLKADAVELPKLHLAIADYIAKHAAVVSRAQEQHNRLERFDGLAREHGDRIGGLELRTREFQGQIGGKADAGTVYSKEAWDLMLKDFYRREEIDAMLTRVWWRVGDTSKSPKHPTPMSPGR